MSLESWVRNGWLIAHRTNRQEIADLLRAADRDLRDCNTSGLSPDWRLAIAHNSALMSATAALAASGYRASREGHRYVILQPLGLTVGADRALLAQLDRFRKKRNLSGYERAGLVCEQEAVEMVGLAERVREVVWAFLMEKHPDLTDGGNDEQH